MKEKVVKRFQFVKKIIEANKEIARKILAGLIILIALIVIASCFKGTEYGNLEGNSNNMGLAVQDGKWIYYVEIDNEEPVGIYKVKTNGKKTEKVVDGNMYYLNIIDNYIYCLEYDEEEARCNLIKIKTNGKNKEILARDIEKREITAVDEWVYYYKNNNLYRVKLNGTDREKVSDREISCYQIVEDDIYYIYEKDRVQYIAKMDLDGEDTERLAKADEDIEFETLYVKGGKIYYITSKQNEEYDRDYYLYKMSKKGKNNERISKIDTNIQNINMQDDLIYYTVTEDYNTFMIKSVKYNGTDKTLIKKNSMAININLAEDWIVFLGENDDGDSIMKMITTDGEKEKNL